MSLVGNERIKLTANALDRLSTVCLTAGAATPLASALYGEGRVSAAHLIIGSYIWIFFALSLHVLAKWNLGRLQE